MLCAVLLQAGGADAADPSQRWYTLTTPHFFVHYYKNVRHDLHDVAQKVARAAEKAHAVLTPLLRHAPSSRTHVVVTDDTEGANASAQSIPFNVMRIFVTGPASLSSLNDYDDWIYSLIVHEYTHILHIGSIHGLPRVINAILGRTWAPNQLQPPWVIEGVATFQESERTSGGRVRGTIFDMLLRVAVYEGKLLELDQISSNTRYYPRGVVRYLYGSRFVKYLADRFGEAKLTRMSHIYGGQAVPYAINRIAKRVFGHTLVALYEDFKRHLKRRYALQRALAEARGLTRFEEVTRHGEAVASPRYSADGRELLYAYSNGKSHAAFAVLDAATGRRKWRVDSFGGSGVTLTPDRRQIVAGQTDNWRTFYSYADLFVRSTDGRRTRRLTRGLRARDPDVSPDGRRVAFVSNDLGSNHLMTVPLAGGRPATLLRGKGGEQVFSPRFSPDGRRLVFSRWVPGGKRDIYVLEVATRRLRRLTDDRALDIDPVFSADGKRVYFSSDRTGIFNVYCYALETGQLWQVTNVLGGAFSPAVSPDESTIYYVGFSSRGYDLHRARIDRRRFRVALPYVNDRPAPPRLPARSDYPKSDYNPLRTVYPRNWIATFGNDAFGSTLGFEVEGGDVVRRHTYRVAMNFSLTEGHPGYGISYSYNRFWPSIQLSTSRSEGPRGGLSLDGERLNYIEENYGAGLTIGLPVLRIPDHAVTVSVGYRFNWFRDGDDNAVFVEPGMVSPVLPNVGVLSGLTTGLSYRNVNRYAFSISSAEGRQINLNLRVNNTALGSDYDSVQFTWAWAEYVDLPWLSHHVLALRLAGGLGRGDNTRRGLFFIGGFPEQNLIDTIIDIAPLGGAYLRGYAPGTFFGDQFHLLNVEYRAPLFDIERGISSLPIYVNNLHLAVFADVGNAFFGHLDPEELNVGVGAELLLEWSIFYVQPFTLRVGYARGLMGRGRKTSIISSSAGVSDDGASEMTAKRVLILGAAGRDFHNFNAVYRADDSIRVVGFTAAADPGDRRPTLSAGAGRAALPAGASDPR